MGSKWNELKATINEISTEAAESLKKVGESAIEKASESLDKSRENEHVGSNSVDGVVSGIGAAGAAAGESGKNHSKEDEKPVKPAGMPDDVWQKLEEQRKEKEMLEHMPASAVEAYMKAKESENAKKTNDKIADKSERRRILESETVEISKNIESVSPSVDSEMSR